MPANNRMNLDWQCRCAPLPAGYAERWGDRMMTKDSEIMFLRAYKDFIYYFNMLDRNMGYCLRWCMCSGQNNRTSQNWLEVTFSRKFKKILFLAKEASSETLFDSWTRKMEACRRMRNIIVHGHWEWKNFLDRPIHYHAPEPFNQEGSFTVEEFQDQLSLLLETSELFSRLRPVLEKVADQEAQPDD
jgi:hypothetical protein